MYSRYLINYCYRFLIGFKSYGYILVRAMFLGNRDFHFLAVFNLHGLSLCIIIFDFR